MSAQLLNERSRRRIERATGQPTDRALGFGSYIHGWRTPGAPGPHRHGWFHLGHYRAAVAAGLPLPLPPGQVWGWEEGNDRIMHWTSCLDQPTASQP